MQFLKFLSPRRAYRDLRLFLSTRKKHEVLFALPALVLTLIMVVGFVVGSKIEQPYSREIIYAESWPLTRTDEEIRAQQAIDKVKKDKEIAEREKRAKELQQQFKRVDDWLTNHGI